MKSLLKISVLAGMAIACLFTRIQAQSIENKASLKDSMSINLLPIGPLIDVRLGEKPIGDVVVIIFDDYSNVLLKDEMTPKNYTEKEYNFEGLENGWYTIEVSSNKHIIKKGIHFANDECSLSNL